MSTVLYCAFPGIYAIIAATISDAFGPDHYQVEFLPEICAIVADTISVRHKASFGRDNLDFC